MNNKLCHMRITSLSFIFATCTDLPQRSAVDRTWSEVSCLKNQLTWGGGASTSANTANMVAQSNTENIQMRFPKSQAFRCLDLGLFFLDLLA